MVHARVVALTSPHEARIEVMESFKGAGERLEALRGNDASCGFTFTPGEERVYFVFGGVVNLCGRAAPRAELLERLRSLKLAAAAACEGVPRPPRPAAVAAIPEAEPAAYEPLEGSDPEIALGVGHVRPAREEQRDDWPRRLNLPVFTSPNAELKLWLTPGSVGFDALVETGYETASFIVLQVRPDGWMQIRFGGPLASGAGWVHRCHLEAATPEARVPAVGEAPGGRGPGFLPLLGAAAAAQGGGSRSAGDRDHPWRSQSLWLAAPRVPRRLGTRTRLDAFDFVRRPQARASDSARGLGALAQPRARALGLVLHARLLKAPDPVEQRARVGRWRIAAPGDVPVRPHQHELALVERGDPWVLDRRRPRAAPRGHARGAQCGSSAHRGRSAAA